MQGQRKGLAFSTATVTANPGAFRVTVGHRRGALQTFHPSKRQARRHAAKVRLYLRRNGSRLPVYVTPNRSVR